jgi:hypothetical protein
MEEYIDMNPSFAEIVDEEIKPVIRTPLYIYLRSL